MTTSNAIQTLNFFSGKNYLLNASFQLTHEEECELGRDYRDNNNLDAAHKLALSGLRYVAHLAKGYKGYGIAEDDIIQQGNIGLLKAVNRFDPDFNGGVRLITFAVHWIKAEIHEYVLKNWRIVKIATTKVQRKLFFNLRKKTADTVGWLTQEKISSVAKDLNVKTKDVASMEGRLRLRDDAYGVAIGSDGEESIPYELSSTSDDFEQVLIDSDHKQKINAVLAHNLSLLTLREQDIVTSRWLSEAKTTLVDLGTKYSISPERVRQVEANALGKLKTSMGSL